MHFEKSGVVRRVEQIPGRRSVMRNYLGDDRATQRGFVRFLGQSNVNVVEGATQQVALEAFAVALRQRLVLIDVRVRGFEHESYKRDRLPFAQFRAVAERNDVGKLRTARRRFALRNARLVIASVIQIAKRLQRYRNNLVHRRAEVVLHCILLVVGGALMTAAVAAEIVDALRLARERFELERQRFAAIHELGLFCRRGCRQKQERQRTATNSHRRLSIHLVTNGFFGASYIYLSRQDKTFGISGVWSTNFSQSGFSLIVRMPC